jgi:hypothetical protein
MGAEFTYNKDTLKKEAYEIAVEKAETLGYQWDSVNSSKALSFNWLRSTVTKTFTKSYEWGRSYTAVVSRPLLPNTIHRLRFLVTGNALVLFGIADRKEFRKSNSWFD